MKLLSSLIGISSIALAVFFALLGSGFVSLPAFLAVAMVWFLLVAVHSYTPRQALRLPRKPASGVLVAKLNKVYC